MSQFPLDAADQCVKCGLCAPHCPTYQLDQMEPESPRGRIAMMAALAQEQFELDNSGKSHLDHCLGCRACESVCPAKVPYIDLLDAHRAAHPGDTRFLRSLLRLLGSRNGQRLLLIAAKFASALQKPGMQLSHALGWKRLQRAWALVPKQSGLALPRSKNSTQYVLSGCMSSLSNRPTLWALEQLANALNIELAFLPAEHCCGALALHGGLAEIAKQQVQKLPADADSFISLDSACAVQLKETGPDVANQEAGRFLLEQGLSQLSFKAHKARALIHAPCTHKNVLKDSGVSTELLQLIPELDIQHIQHPHCCGAAGMHMLQEADRANQFLAPKLAEIAAAKPDYLISTNIGCSLHIAAGLKNLGLNVPVMHPLQLLHQQLNA